MVAIIMLSILMLVVLAPFLPTILGLIVKTIRVIVKGIIWLFSLPFKIGKNKEKKQ